MRLLQYGMVVEKYIKNMVGIDKYVIMPDHIHLIIFITDNDEEAIPQKIKSLKILVTKEIGFSLWQRLYHDRIIRSQKEYERIWEYIDHNPEQWEYKKIKYYAHTIKRNYD
ncbi:MAG: transposase [Chitinophagaceae bacterium]